MKLPVGIGDFKKLCKQQYFFIDKTMFIKEVLDDGTAAFLITRPRRFGKTLNMSMLRYFFDIQHATENRRLFDNTLIAKAHLENGQSCMDFQGQYPVIFITFKDLRADHYEAMYADILLSISQFYKQHDYLLQSNQLSDKDKNDFDNILNGSASSSLMNTALFQLTAYLHQHYGKPVMVFLDEYDTPMHAAYEAKKPYHETLINFMRVFLGSAFKDNIHLRQGILTGILRVSLMNLFSGVNSMPVRTILTRHYSEHFGFTESEVVDLCAKTHLPLNLAEIKHWYNGYQIHNVVLYNPWSIIRCLDERGLLQPYWIQTGEHGVLGKALISSPQASVLQHLEQLMNDDPIDIQIEEGTIFSHIESNESALWSLMLFAGYLKVVSERLVDGFKYVKLLIPNFEVKTGFKGMIQRFSQLPKDSQSIYTKLVATLTHGNIDALKELIQQYLQQTISYYDFNSNTEERFYHIFLLGMFLTLKDHFMIESNKEAGNGRFDIILIPKCNNIRGLIIELKRPPELSRRQRDELEADIYKKDDYMETLALEAIKQIKQRQYHTRFQQHGIHKIVLVGVVFLGKDVAVKYEVQGQ